MNLIIICGGTGQGKSKLTNEKLLGNEVFRNTMQGKDNYRITHKSKNQYIFDLYNEYQLPTDQILRPQMRNVDCDEKKFINNCANLRNTNIVFEDASGFLRGRQEKMLARLIVKRRHVNNNWIILFHSIANVPPELMRYCNYLIIFKTNDNAREIENKFNNPLINEAFEKLTKMPQHSFIQLKLL